MTRPGGVLMADSVVSSLLLEGPLQAGSRDWVGHYFARQEPQRRVQVLAEKVFNGTETSKQQTSSVQLRADSSQAGMHIKV
ncbi:hypothetical protein NDU88_004089 [Pleurodeles waltl]|uniref:Uncharacterized protein n=1 Tax=Pleurodeles waltl TaxID=8319 RepID=A0AAV7M7C3_PLEWA|nr:hypothetical protein NDU88_004089 [Pleurodeles waltl]